MVESKGGPPRSPPLGRCASPTQRVRNECQILIYGMIRFAAPGISPRNAKYGDKSSPSDVLTRQIRQNSHGEVWSRHSGFPSRNRASKVGRTFLGPSAARASGARHRAFLQLNRSHSPELQRRILPVRDQVPVGVREASGRNSWGESRSAEGANNRGSEPRDGGRHPGAPVATRQKEALSAYRAWFRTLCYEKG